MVDLQLNGRSSLFILFGFPETLNAMELSFPINTLLFLDAAAQLLALALFSGFPLWPSQEGTQVLLSFLLIPLGWVTPSALTVSVTINAQLSGTHTPNLQCFSELPEKKRPADCKLPMSSWMPPLDKVESITSSSDHFSLDVFCIHL